MHNVFTHQSTSLFYPLLCKCHEITCYTLPRNIHVGETAPQTIDFFETHTLTKNLSLDNIRELLEPFRE